MVSDRRLPWATHTQVVAPATSGTVSVWPATVRGGGVGAALHSLSIANAPPESVRVFISDPARIRTEYHLPPELALQLADHDIAATPSSPVEIEAVNLTGLPISLVARFTGAEALRVEDASRRVTDDDDLLLAGEIATLDPPTPIGRGNIPTGDGGGLFVQLTTDASGVDGSSASPHGSDYRLLPADASGIVYRLGRFSPRRGAQPTGGLVAAWTVTLVGPSPAELEFTHHREEAWPYSHGIDYKRVT